VGACAPVRVGLCRFWIPLVLSPYTVSNQSWLLLLLTRSVAQQRRSHHHAAGAQTGLARGQRVGCIPGDGDRFGFHTVKASRAIGLCGTHDNGVTHIDCSLIIICWMVIDRGHRLEGHVAHVVVGRPDTLPGTFVVVFLKELPLNGTIVVAVFIIAILGSG